MKKLLSKIVKEYENYEDNRSSESAYKWTDLCDENEEKLYSNTYKNYNKKNFNTLIESIEANGITSFNMTTFVSNIRKYLKRDTNQLTHEIKVLHDGSALTKNSFCQATSSFNCDSVGCIAGFATANALNWEQPKWMTGDPSKYSHFFEQVACNWLNIPLECGRNIFYGDVGSVWSFVRFFEPENYQEIKWHDRDEDYSYDGVEAEVNPYFSDWVWFSSFINLDSIHHKYAVDVLRRIVNGEILISEENDFVPVYSQKYNKNKKYKQYNPKNKKETGDSNGNK